MAATNPKALDLSPEQRQVLESLLRTFDRNWDEHRLASQVRQLPPKGNPLRLAALIELVKIDLRRQWQHGRHAKLEAYLKALPELGTADTIATDLIQAEYEARQQAGAAPDLAKFTERFPRQAEELRRLVAQAGAQASTADDAQATRTTVGPAPATHPPARPGAAPGPLPEQFGRYRILKKLGQGGMGTVYLAHDSQLDRQVALKVPRFTPEDGPEILERFYREARAAATLSHPNICPVFDVSEVNGTHYVTMAFIEGKPLSELIADGKPLPQRPVAAVVRKLAAALQEAHQRGVIHRDLKPANVMINQRKEPVIMDFGLARRVKKGEGRLTKDGAILGTPAYMAPEQVKGDVAAMGPGCDIYSLGVVLYELLTGKLPFEGPMMALLGQILTQEPEKPSAHRPDLDPQLEAICLKAMAKKIEDRYASMADFAQALGEYLRGEGGSQPAGDGPKASKTSAVFSPKARVAASDPADEGLATQLLAKLVARLETGAGTRAASEPHGSRWWIPLAAAVAILLALGAIFYAVNRPPARVEAQVVVQLEGIDKWLEEVYKGKDRSLVIILIDGQAYSAEQLAKPIGLNPGPHELELKRKDGTSVEKRKFTVGGERGEQKIDLASTEVFERRPREKQPTDDASLRAPPAPKKDTPTRVGQEDKGPFKGLHTGLITSLAFSPDGKALATGSRDKTLILWDVDTHSRKWDQTHPGYLTSLVFTADGKTLAAGDSDGTTILWDPATGKDRASFKRKDEYPSHVAISANGRTLASWGGFNAYVWDAGTRKELGVLHVNSGGVTSAAVSPDGNTVVYGDGGSSHIRRWDVATRQELSPLKGHADDVHALAFSPDGKTLASASADKTVRLWDLATGKVRATMRGHKERVFWAYYSADGKTLVTSTDNTRNERGGEIKLWDLDTNQERPLRQNLPRVYGSALTPDGRTLAVVVEGKTEEVQMWDVEKLRADPDAPQGGP